MGEVEREMVELALHDELENIYTEVLEDQTTRIHLGMNHKSDDIKEHLGNELNEAQLNLAVNLLADDNTDRDFINTPQFVLIKPLSS